MLAYTYTRVPLICEILVLLILSKISFSIISVQTKEQTQKPGVCCPAYPCDSYAPATLRIRAPPETAEAVFDK